MAGLFKFLYAQEFTSTDSVTVTHNLNRKYISVRLLVNDKTRQDLISNIELTKGNELNELTISLSSSQTGIIHIYESDVVDTGISSDEFVKVSDNDTTSSYLNGKLVSGTGVSLTENNDGGNETLTITNTSLNVDQNLFETITGDSGSTTADSITDTLNVVGGTSITTAIVGDTLTITNDDPNVDQNLWETIVGDSGSTSADTATDTLTIDGGTGISTAIVGDTMTITNTSPNVDQNIYQTITGDSGSTTANTTTDSLDVSGGTNITTSVSPDTVTITGVNIWNTVAGDSGSTTPDTALDTITFAGGTGITTAMAGDTLTITNDSPNVDQNLWETINADTGSTTANTTTDTLTVAGGTGISTSISGDTLTIDSSLSTDDLPSVFVGLTTTTAIPTTFANVSWPTTHVENNTAVIEHDNVNTDRILIKETGLYIISFNMSFDADAGEEQIQGRVLIDDTTVVPGSLRLASEDDEINDLSNTFTAELTSGTYLTFQHQASGTGNTLHNSSNFSVTRATGVKGDTGPAGSGSTINIEQDNVAVSNTPHSTLNFQNMSATDAGSGQVNIQNVFGSEFVHVTDASVSSTSSETFQNKATLNTGSVPAGTYRVGFHYGFNNDSVSSDFEARFLEDGSQIGEIHKQEGIDQAGSFNTTGTSQRYLASKVFYRTLTATTHSFTLQYRTDDNSDLASIWDAVIEFWRVS